MAKENWDEITSAFRLITPVLNICLTIIATLILGNMKDMKENQHRFMDIVLQNEKRISRVEWVIDDKGKQGYFKNIIDK